MVAMQIAGFLSMNSGINQPFSGPTKTAAFLDKLNYFKMSYLLVR